MNQKFYSILSLFFLTLPSLFAAENDTVGRTRQDILQGVLLDRAGSDMAGRMSWENPALLPWMLPQSRCNAVADYSSEKESQPLTGGKGEAPPEKNQATQGFGGPSKQRKRNYWTARESAPIVGTFSRAVLRFVKGGEQYETKTLFLVLEKSSASFSKC